MKYAIYQTDDKRVATLKKLEWTTTPPTQPGMYQAVSEEGILSWVEFCEDDFFICGSYFVEPAQFTRWLGPIPLADLPERDE